ncbi:hypothetical protein FRB95_001152 [Tulasnella sp. JGI-2019a]|nr:hypothetical protein FRB95_001152 [Tulasnella sp. JGI-2019a]
MESVQDIFQSSAGAALQSQPTNVTSPSTATNFDLFAFSSSFGDWLKLAILGGALEFARRTWAMAWAWFLSSFFITASFDGDDDAYAWMLIWLSKRTAWTKSRELQVSIQNLNVNRYLDDDTVATVGDDDTNGTRRKLVFLPSFGTTHTIWFRGHFLRVTRDRQFVPEQGKQESLTLSILGRNHSILTDILKEAQALHKEEESNRVSIFIADNYNNWRYSGSRPKRPLSSVILDHNVKETILEDAEDFLASEKWYAERGIPFRRGYLLHGAPGSGKTSLIHALAGALKLDIYVISLSKRGLDDSQLNELICDLPARSIALMEDIDAAFTHGISRDDDNSPPTANSSASQDSPRGITLSGLLGAIDGVAAQEGRILMATTNRYNVLDQALIRPGRLDLHIEFQLATSWQAGEIFKCFYLSTDHKEDEAKQGTDSHISEKTPLLNGSSDANGETPPTPGLERASRRSAPKLTITERDALAASFAAEIPDHVASMASIQGHLMTYKTRPYEAIKNAPTFIDSEKKKAAARAEEAAKKAAAAAASKVPAVAAPAVTVAAVEKVETASAAPTESS